ncbi:MAG: hypothetical protein P1P82_14650 [Bacteroidales bacterium]|nr:hypothetical protein [Bacteroidales bacterium]MDT8432329.1 hypothetical protein [Bacteroidales bacterium]
MKNSKTTRIISIVLGAFLVLYAANQFLHFLPSGYGKMPDFTRDYLDAMLPFLPALYIFEIILGLAFITNKWVPFLVIILAPLSVNFLIFNLANGGWNILSAAFVALLNLVLIYQYRDRYKPLFR